MKSFDVSNNKLEGPIPESLVRFGPVSFAGNEGLCGKPLEKQCDSPSSEYTLADSKTESSSPSWVPQVIGLVIMAVIMAVVFLFVKSRQRKREDNFSVVSRDSSVDEVMQVIDTKDL